MDDKKYTKDSTQWPRGPSVNSGKLEGAAEEEEDTEGNFMAEKREDLIRGKETEEVRE